MNGATDARHMRYHTVVIDIGSPKLGNIGWCAIDGRTGEEHTGQELDALCPHIARLSRSHGVLLGLEAPLCVPLRNDLMLATKARAGEGRRPWSAGAGAQVLAMNLPIMCYLFDALHAAIADIDYLLNEQGFQGQAQHIMLFEALVSGADKGQSHIEDACIMARYCHAYSQEGHLPHSILEDEVGTRYFNLAASALLRCGYIHDHTALAEHTPIYRPSS